MKIKVKKLHPDSKLPVRAHQSDAGLDVFTYEDISIKSGEKVAISTGISASIPDGYASLVWDKSGLAIKGLKTLGGVIDSGYNGEYKIIIINLSKETYYFKKGDKVAQILIQKVELCEVEEILEMECTDRGMSGFGSTGV